METTLLEIAVENTEYFATDFVNRFFKNVAGRVKAFYGKDYLTVIIPTENYKLLNSDMLKCIVDAKGVLYLTEYGGFINIDFYFRDFV